MLSHFAVQGYYARIKEAVPPLSVALTEGQKALAFWYSKDSVVERVEPKVALKANAPLWEINGSTTPVPPLSVELTAESLGSFLEMSKKVINFPKGL